MDPTPVGRAKDGHLRGAVLLPISNSGFVSNYTVVPKMAFTDPCGPDPGPNGPLEPQRYNPWPRFLAGYKGILENNYRPHPISEGIDYDLSNLETGTTYQNKPALV